MFTPESHNPHPHNSQDWRIYHFLFRSFKQKFIQRTHDVLIDKERIIVWYDLLSEYLTVSAPGDQYFGVAARERALIATHYRFVIRPPVKKPPVTPKRAVPDEQKYLATKEHRNRQPLNLSVRYDIKKSDVVCRYCMKRKVKNIDHIIPRAQGGSNDPRNLVGSCTQCNLFKGPLTPKQAGMTLHIPLRFFDYIDMSPRQVEPSHDNTQN